MNHLRFLWGFILRRLFISYARENKRDVDQLAEQLGLMGYETWVDFKLRGGQQWWAEILQRISDTEVFIAVISHASLNSTACRREFDWAEALDKPILPVAIEPLPAALPRRFAERQIIDYSQAGQRDRAALMLQGGLATIGAARPLPDPLPEPPAAPLSYLTDLVDLISGPDPLDHAQQHQILQQLGAALHSVDPEERRGARDILERFASRADLYADVDRIITGFRELPRPATPRSEGPAASEPAFAPGADVVAEPAAAPSPSTGHDVQRSNDGAEKPLDEADATLDHTDSAPLSETVGATEDFGQTGRESAPTTDVEDAHPPSESATTEERPSPADFASTQGQSSATERTEPTTPRGRVDPVWRRKRAAIPAAIALVAVVCVGIWFATAQTGSRPQPPRGTTSSVSAPVAQPPSGSPAPVARTQTVIPTPGIYPAGIAADRDGDIYVADTNSTPKRIVKIAAGSNTQVPLPFTFPPTGSVRVAVDNVGAVYAAAGDDNRVYKLDPGSDQPVPLPFEGLAGPSAVAVNSWGDVFVTDMWNGPNGRVLMLPVGHGPQTVLPFADISRPWGVAADDAGDVFVANSITYVQKLPDGASADIKMDNTFCAATVAASPSGTAYVGTAEGILSFPPGKVDGTLISGVNFKNGKGGALAADPAGNVYVGDGESVIKITL
ncbi:MAG TPA: TIR domain-containing protein [Mycobacterium sp.]|nr:TIR domain-containing protein [Mycobacterium sp.]